MERTERQLCTDPRGECRAVRGSCLQQPLPSPCSDALFHHLLGPRWAPGPFGKPRVGEMRSHLWLEHVILDRRKREQVGALWLGALPACPLSQPSFLRWDKLWTRLTLIPAGPGSKVDSSYARGGGKKFQVPTPAIAPSCFSPTFRLEDVLYLGQSGFIEAPGQHRAAYLLPLWSCVWDPGGWGDLFYRIPGCKTGETRTRSGSGRPKANSRL